MKRLIVGSVVFALIAALTIWVAFGTGQRSGSDDRNAPAGQGAPQERQGSRSIEEVLRSVGIQAFSGPQTRIDFELPDLTERMRSLADYRGQVVFLNFWATWCPPCIEEMPSMQRLADELRDHGLVVVAVNVQEDRSTVEPFVDDLELTFEILLDRRGRTGQSYGVRGLPTTVLLDREGHVMATKLGFAVWDAPEMIDALRTLLRER
ncbi:MAG: TlpA family protein disulfide reductase [Spirochaetaceae bacterium]|nr:MAG: TlpA family protein disulfide reductase [Spirochaetaceae bacterium]